MQVGMRMNELVVAECAFPKRTLSPPQERHVILLDPKGDYHTLTSAEFKYEKDLPCAEITEAPLKQYFESRSSPEMKKRILDYLTDHFSKIPLHRKLAKQPHIMKAISTVAAARANESPRSPRSTYPTAVTVTRHLRPRELNSLQDLRARS